MSRNGVIQADGPVFETRPRDIAIGYNALSVTCVMPQRTVTIGAHAEAMSDSITIGYGAKTGEKEIMIANPAIEKYNKITLGHVDVLDLVNRLERLEAYVAHHPALVDFDALEAATEKAMAETASDETVFVNPPETGSTIELKRR
jgi:hypothetical protein